VFGVPDFEGRVAVAGNFGATNFEVARLNPGGNALVVGGNMTLTNGMVYGHGWYGGAATVSSVRFGVDAEYSNLRGTPIDFEQECGIATVGSYALSAIPANGETVIQGTCNPAASYRTCGVTLQPRSGDTAVQLYVFELDASQVNSAYSIAFTGIPAGSPVVVQVRGGPIVFTNFGLSAANGGYPTANDIIWNFAEAAEVVLDPSLDPDYELTLTNFQMEGTILAPFADVYMTYGQVNGSIFARNLHGTTEFHHRLFRHQLVCPAECSAGHTRLGPTACTTDGGEAGVRRQVCGSGAWLDDPGACVVACAPGSTRSGTTSCGYNNRGAYEQVCTSGGLWTDATTCIQSDVCVDGTTRSGSTACAGGGTLRQLCATGQWQDTTTCLASTGASFVCTGTCLGFATLSKNQNSNNLGEGERWFKVTDAVAGWQVSNLASRTITVNGIATTAGGTLPPRNTADNAWYFRFSAGVPAWTAWSFW
jgi:choice-of-anchor A domain-containing protein